MTRWQGAWQGVWDAGNAEASGVINAGLVATGAGYATFGAQVEGGTVGAGKRKPQTYAEAWREHEHYLALAQAWIDEQDEDRPEPKKVAARKKRKGKPAVTPTPVAQDAPKQPRMAEPAPSLAWLLDNVEREPVSDALMLAMISGQLEAIARAAHEADMAIRNDDEALATLLVLLAA